MYMSKQAVVCRYLCGAGKKPATSFLLTGLRVGKSVFPRQISMPKNFTVENFDVKETSYYNSLDSTMNSRKTKKAEHQG